MKKGQIILLIMNFILIIVSLFNIFFEILNTNRLILFLLFIFIINYKYFKLEKNIKYYNKDILFNILIICFIYTLLTYLSGIWVGFLKNPYNITLIKVIARIIPVIFVIILSELIRYIFITKGSKYKSIIVLTFISFVFLDVTLLIKFYDFSINDKILEFILFLMTVITKNIFLIYLTYKTNYKFSILYRLYIELPIYIVPLLPNIPNYINTFINFLLPVLLFFIIYKQVGNKNIEKSLPNNHSIIRKLLYTTSFITLLFIFMISSGYFKFYSLTVGSNSMVPVIYRGDVIIIEKLNEEEIDLLKVGDVMVFHHDDIVVIHRIIEIKDNIYYTKGDNNNAPDDYHTIKEDIIGQHTFTIKFVGLPIVWFNEMIK